MYIRQGIATFLSHFVPTSWHKAISIEMHRRTVRRLKKKHPKSELDYARIRWYEQRLRAWE